MFKIWINVSNPQQKEIVLTVNKINQILTKKYARVINQTVHEISRSILSLFYFLSDPEVPSEMQEEDGIQYKFQVYQRDF